MGKRLAGKVAVITGSTAGIGRAVAERFVEEGAKVVINDHGADPDLANEAVAGIEKLGGDVSYYKADVGDAAQLRGLIAHAADTYGRLDILMNNAWSGRSVAVTEMEDEDWERAFAVTVKACAVSAKAAGPHMVAAGGGSIINTSSVHGILAARSNAAYNALKAGIINLTRQMAVDLGRDGIRVNAICPGRIVTEAKVKMLERSPDEVRRQKYVYPLGRPGTMREAANAVLFLASDESSFVTGHALVVDGGMTAQLQDSVSAWVEKGLLDELGIEE